MGIDIKELRIGNHIICNGVRAKVVDLQTCRFAEKVFHIGVKGISPQTGEEKIVGATANSDYIQSIPITEELLIELGFEKDDDNIINVPVFSKEIDGFFIEVKKFNVYDEWRVHIDDCDRDSIGMLDLHYLHELENLVYMATKKELL